MASSSSSFVPTQSWTYDVFLSFRGEDIRNTFIDHLYRALDQKGIRVFKDDEMLRIGKPISSELLKAIEESWCAVVVFSKNYANSSWCLDELAKIMECQDQLGQKVFPIFYHVDPSDVRRQKRDFATAFQQHEEKFRGEMDKINKWRKALAGAGNLSGWDITPDSGSESFLINKIVQKISNDIPPRSVENNLFGIESRIDELNSLLGIEATQEVRMVGICGMGGIGKTTIAQTLFRRIYRKFEGSSFVKGVRKNSKRDICALQEKILKDIMHHESKIADPVDGAEMIQTRISHKKVLLVLDDVDDVKQLEFLAARHEWFGAGSRIIITTRDESLLSDTNAKYKPTILLKEQAVELFCRHAFRKNTPPKGYEELSNRAIRYTGRLPLALKVLGSYFHGRQAGVWDSALNRLAKTPNRKIFETLKISFDGLEVSEKKIFLDIACFFKGKDKHCVTRILDSFGFDPVIGISVLIEKSLIIDSNGLDMHDLVQEMGWEIVRESYPNSRLWQHEEIHDVIEKNMELKAIEGIVDRFNDHYDENGGFSADVFKSMKNLRLLDIVNDFTSCKPTFLPDELRWLCWHRYPFSSLPIASMRKLVGLEISIGKIEQLWMGQKVMPYLKFIFLKQLDCLVRFPDVSGSPNIERLILSNCSNLMEVHESLGSCRRLVLLDMRGCTRLKCLPSRIEMESLETLDLSNCYSLEKFPEVSSCMIKLSNIYLNGCRNLVEVHDSLGSHKRLVNLDMGGCTSLKCLPSRIEMESLDTLDLSKCRSLEKFPEVSPCMTKLSNIYLNGCTSLKDIPNSICELKYLKSLHLHNCMELQKLPEQLGSMEKLEVLWLGFTGDYEDLKKLSKSNNLCTLTNLCCLRKLDLSWRQIKEEDFPDNLHAFSSLEELHLSGNSELVQLPASISSISCLKHLELNNCRRLQNLQALPSGIQLLKASNCRALEHIEDLTVEYVWLYKIWLTGCKKLLKYRGNEEFLANMLEKSFLKECIAVDHVLSIAIPGSKIPSWFQEQEHGYQMTLKLSPKRIMGFAVCGLFLRKWLRGHGHPPRIFFKLGHGRTPSPESDWDLYNHDEEWDFVCSNLDSSKYSAIDQSVWIVYIPFRSFQQKLHGDFEEKDWPLLVKENLLTIKIFIGGTEEVIRCGAHVVYKKDVESIQQINTCPPDYEISDLNYLYDHFLYREKLRSIDL